jgi:hypothetical protein
MSMFNFNRISADEQAAMRDASEYCDREMNVAPVIAQKIRDERSHTVEKIFAAKKSSALFGNSIVKASVTNPNGWRGHNRKAVERWTEGAIKGIELEKAHDSLPPLLESSEPEVQPNMIGLNRLRQEAILEWEARNGR